MSFFLFAALLCFSGAVWFIDTIMGLWDGHVMALRFLFFFSFQVVHYAYGHGMIPTNSACSRDFRFFSLPDN